MFIYIALAIAAIWTLIWLRGGLSKGRKFGNKIAEHLGMSSSFFHSVLDNGVSGPSLQLLATLESAGCTLNRASVELAPSLKRGLFTLENRFGRQEMIDNAKPIVAQLMKGWEELQEQRAQQ